MKLPYLVKTSKLNPPANPCRIFPPSISEAPQINHMTVPMQKSIRFFIIMLPAFFALVKPASHMANPACIQNTSAAPARNHTAKTSPSNAFIISSVITISFLLQAYLCTGASLRRRSLFTSVPLRRRSYAIKKGIPPNVLPRLCGMPFSGTVYKLLCISGNISQQTEKRHGRIP